MKKRKNQATKPSENKQGNILSFFQPKNVATKSNTAPHRTNLFSAVNGTTPAGTGTLRAKTVASGSVESDGDDCVIVTDTPIKIVAKHSNQTGCENSHSVTRPCAVDVKGKEAGRVTDNHRTCPTDRLTDAEPDLIPDTPDRHPNKHLSYSRSFLCSVTMLNPTGKGPTTAKVVRAKKPRRKLCTASIAVNDAVVASDAMITSQLCQRGIALAQHNSKNKQAPSRGLSPKLKRRLLMTCVSDTEKTEIHKTVRTPEVGNTAENRCDGVLDETDDVASCGDSEPQPAEEYRPYQWSREAKVTEPSKAEAGDEILSGILNELKSTHDPDTTAEHDADTCQSESLSSLASSDPEKATVERVLPGTEPLSIARSSVSVGKKEGSIASESNEYVSSQELSGCTTVSNDSSAALADIIQELQQSVKDAGNKVKIVNTKKTISQTSVNDRCVRLKQTAAANARCQSGTNISKDCVKGKSIPASHDCQKQSSSKADSCTKNDDPSLSFTKELVKDTEISLRNDQLCQSSDELNSDLMQYFINMSPFKAEVTTLASASHCSRPPSGSFDIDHESPSLNVDRDNSRSRSPVPSDSFGRHMVIAVQNTRDCIQLDLTAEGDRCQRTVFLRDFWTDTEVCVGDIVHVLGKFSADGTCSVTDAENLIVVNPDVLVSGTNVVSSLFCMRKTVLGDKFRGFDKNVQMLNGSIIHTLFQRMITLPTLSEDVIMAIATEVLGQKKYLHELYGQSLNEDTVLREIRTYVPSLLACADKYFATNDKAAKNQSAMNADDKIVNIVDIEENIWSPRFGLKGRIDLTVETGRGKGKARQVLPLELKTGKETYSAEHRGQVTLYSMMMSDRREDPRAGLLMYLKTGTMRRIPADHACQRGLIQIRNSLSRYMQPCVVTSEQGGPPQIGALPPPVDKQFFCSKCPQLLNCALLQRAEGLAVPAGHAMAELVPQALAHLSDGHLQYFTRWCLLVHMEAAVDTKTSTLRDVWCRNAADREAAGECWSHMVIVDAQCRPFGEESFLQTFTRHESHNSGVRPLTAVKMNVGDSVVVSEQILPLIALSNGFVQAVSTDTVTLTLDRNLCAYPGHAQMQFRLDKGNTFNTMGTPLVNLSRLMADNPVSARLRELIIDKRRPEFDLTLPKQSIKKVKHIFKTLNKPQKTAILKVLMSKDYVLIKGYPGTGKTSTIVSLVQILVTLGQSVLLTSYTNSAVDNVLMKLKTLDIEMTRLGRLAKIHPDIVAFCAEHQTRDLHTVDELTDFYNSKAVVSTTCLGGGEVLRRRVFDVCIVDEASQVSQSVCLAPLFSCHKFVLVGDPLQLPPLVRSHAAKDLGMDRSLFVELDDTGGTYELNLQYRMNRNIMHLSNTLVYDNALHCGSEQVATATLQVTPLPTGLPDWLNSALNPSAGAEVIFLNMDQALVTEDVCTVENRAEADVIALLVQTALSVGVCAGDIGVIAPYQQQVRRLRDVLRRSGTGAVEVNTVDQYQGRDKAAIFISFVKHTAARHTGGGILADMCRLNVAVTRAKHKLVMVGSVRALQSYSPVYKLINILKPHQMVCMPEETVKHCADLLVPCLAFHESNKPACKSVNISQELCPRL